MQRVRGWPASSDEHDAACAMAHGTVPAPTAGRRLVAVFASPVARELAHTAGHVGFDVVVLEPDLGRDGAPYPTVRTAAAAHIDDTTDVVVTDHDRAELGLVLADVLTAPARWVGVMGKASIVGPHVAALQELGRRRGDDRPRAPAHRAGHRLALAGRDRGLDGGRAARRPQRPLRRHLRGFTHRVALIRTRTTARAPRRRV